MVAPYPIPINEENRIKALAEYHLMDSPPEKEFDRLAELASRLFHVPIVLISLLDRDRQYFKARVGLDVCETSREVSFCAHAIIQDDILIIPDAMQDKRFNTNPLVLGQPYIRFYAGRPLITPTGEKIGTVCLIDSKPRRVFTAEDRKTLEDVAELIMDRFELRRLEYARTVSQARFENIAATSPDAIICSNSKGTITFWNHSAERLFGYSVEEAIHKPSDIIVPATWRRIYDSELNRLRKGEKMLLANKTVELSALRKDGAEFPAEFSLSTWQEGPLTSVGAIVRDITERRHNEERLFRLASVDALTELPNRAALQECLKQTLASEKPATVILMDLDGFKEVNDTRGHSAGDAVLKIVAERIGRVCQEAIMVARLGGDEFVVLLSGIDEAKAINTAAKLLSLISQPYQFDEQRCEVGVSIGIAFAPPHGIGSEELLSAADLALYRAKAEGRGRFRLFEPAMRDVAIARRNFEQELRRAFENSEFELFYQPQVLIADKRLIGAEALMRWNHPQRGLLSPISFIEVLGQKPSAAAVGEWVLRTACQQAAVWRMLIPNFRIGVNLFEAQFRSGTLLSSVREALSEANLPPDALELELVENILLRSDDSTVRLLTNLRDLGVGLAFDDYGTGFASLSLLKRYPVNRLKIDRSFVREVHTSPGDAAVVKAILYLGQSFGMQVIAEGVETEDQLKFLKENDCSEAQGYLFGKPVSAAQFGVNAIREKQKKVIEDEKVVTLGSIIV